MCKFAIVTCKLVIGMCKFAIGMCKFAIGMCKFAVGMCKSEVCLVLILCTCELYINWSLFVVTNKIIGSIQVHWDWTGRISDWTGRISNRTGRISNSLNSCRQEAFL
jgi:hypothetical protein